MTGRHINIDGGLSESLWNQSSHLFHACDISCSQLVPKSGRLVVVAPHPDDEILSCGGLLQQHTSSGGVAHVISVTDGEASHNGLNASSRKHLALRRGEERAEGLRRLGLQDVVATQLSLPDGEVEEHNTVLITRLLYLLQATDTVVTCWRLDGHPDHDAVGAACAAACEIVGSQLIESPVWMWHWAELDDVRVPWCQLRRLPLSSSCIQRKIDALAAHHSQLESRNATDGPVLDARILARQQRPYEYFFVNEAVGR